MQLNNREDLLNMPTSQLNELLRAEARKEEPDGDLIQTVMDVLDERTRQDGNDIPINGEEAWAQYKASKAADAWNKKRRMRNRIIQAAATAAAVFALVFVMPRAVNANNFFEMIARWTEDVFEFFNGEHGGEVEYVFETDNEDLQKVYDAVVAIGVTEPAVPMWLPDECQLIEIKDMSTPKRARMFARFSALESEVTITVDLYGAVASYEIPKDEEIYRDYEYNGMTHYIIKNEGVWTVIWSKDTMVGYITIECPEDTLYQIVRSIYTMEAVK